MFSLLSSVLRCFFTTSPNPSNYGQAVALTATVTAGAAGKVTFYDGVTILGVGTLSGTQASISGVMPANFDIPGATCTMTGDTTASVADIQFIVNEALGIVPANNDLNNDGVVNITDVQKVVGAVLYSSCLH